MSQQEQEHVLSLANGAGDTNENRTESEPKTEILVQPSFENINPKYTYTTSEASADTDAIFDVKPTKLDQVKTTTSLFNENPELSTFVDGTAVHKMTCSDIPSLKLKKKIRGIHTNNYCHMLNDLIDDSQPPIGCSDIETFDKISNMFMNQSAEKKSPDDKNILGQDHKIIVTDNITDQNSIEEDGQSHVSMETENQKLIIETLLGPSATSTGFNSPGGSAVIGPGSGTNARGNYSLFPTKHRDRFESWGGLSDVSQHLSAVAYLSSVGVTNPQPSSFYLWADVETSEQRMTDIEEDINDESSSIITGKHRHPKKRYKASSIDDFITDEIPFKISFPENDSLQFSRDRHDSIASFPGFFRRDRFDSLASLGDGSFNVALTEQLADLAGKLESVVDSLDPTDGFDHIVTHLDANLTSKRNRMDSDTSPYMPISSVASSNHIEEDNISDVDLQLHQKVYEKVDEFKHLSSNRSIASSAIHVDSEAVQAAVEAALAVTSNAGLDFLNMLTPSPPISQDLRNRQCSTNKQTQKRKLPLSNSAVTTVVITASPKKPKPTKTTKSNKIKLEDSPPSTLPSQLPPSSQLAPSKLSEEELEAIRARARAAAGYVHPSQANPGTVSTPSLSSSSESRKRSKSNKKTPKIPDIDMVSSSNSSSLPPLKKRASAIKDVMDGFHVENTTSLDSITPKRKNTTKSMISKSRPSPDIAASADKVTPAKVNNNVMPNSGKKSGSSRKCEATDGQTIKKWNEMFDCLLEYVKEVKLKETANMTEEQKLEWEWDGNVPTLYKTKDGKALGRWVNNQRTAKSKGSLKADRDVRLVSTGLKWSVLTTNAWSDMLEELRIYVNEKTKDGSDWDGNVPTNYKIKSNTAADGTEIDEDKNLGRWVNRQRCLFQAGKLKKERQIELETIGLKWAVLSTSSWQTMFDALCEYVTIRKNTDPKGQWDGNVPANHETDHKPPKRLGRWVNRQRVAYASNKLKDEFIVKLEEVGLKWSAGDLKRSVEKKNRSKVDDDQQHDSEDDDSCSESDDSTSTNGKDLKEVSCDPEIHRTSANHHDPKTRSDSMSGITTAKDNATIEVVVV